MVLENETHKILKNFEIKADLHNPGQKSRLRDCRQKKKKREKKKEKKRTCQIVDFAVSADHRMKIKENQKKKKKKKKESSTLTLPEN